MFGVYHPYTFLTAGVTVFDAREGVHDFELPDSSDNYNSVHVPPAFLVNT